ncbi:pilus assembly protein TadG-related protein [Altererythrobacter sp. C41]|uniref:pilus assembly protein TadG-related protein n=1 Tax=Altererythrobacter sp. C41 TaxID=2806021 RepID=UPI001931B437|nr:VWA domain-containing protein [Altererythrobacter sp. C41]
MGNRLASTSRSIAGMLTRLGRDRSGNTLAIIAAAIAPILAMVGGGIDMGRSYLSQSRLQQACDAGVLAARKRLGAQAAVTGEISPDVAETGQRFFNINFRSGSYGTEDRDFVMTLEEDLAISGVATVSVPTTIMQIFDFTVVPVSVECEAQIDFANTDVMMVLDVTGSMAEHNPGEAQSRLDAMKQTVANFHAQLAAASQAGSRIRYGFVPYSTNVRVGHLLRDEWVTGTWSYQSREQVADRKNPTTRTYTTGATKVSGDVKVTEYESYKASFTELDGYHCPSRPGSNVTTKEEQTAYEETPVVEPREGVRKEWTYVRTRTGQSYSTVLDDTTCIVRQHTYNNYVDTYKRVQEPSLTSEKEWRYAQIEYDVSDWRNIANGCIEERDTYEIGNYSAVDLGRALDLDLDRVPSSGNPATQWRPMIPSYIYGRALQWNGKGKFQTNEKITGEEYVSPVGLETAACPAPSRKLSEMTADELQDYLETLRAEGSTYHDIGMIWGGRLISPTGLFAAENADAVNSVTSRHLIFLTDGETAPLDLSYSSYGFEPLDQRRWSPDSPLSLAETVERRFAFACSEVRRKNVTVWVIGFGIALTDVMKNCAGEGRYFEAADAAELNASFAAIAESMSDLRVSR